MTKQTVAERLAERVEAARREADRSIRWLSIRTGISYSTLRRRLREEPKEFTALELLAIAAALHIHIESLLPDEVELRELAA